MMEPEWKMNATCVLMVAIGISLGWGMGLTTADKDRVGRSRMEDKIEGSVLNDMRNVGIEVCTFTASSTAAEAKGSPHVRGQPELYSKKLLLLFLLLLFFLFCLLVFQENISPCNPGCVGTPL